MPALARRRFMLEAISVTDNGALLRNQKPIKIAAKKDPLEEKTLTQKEREKSGTVDGDRYPMPDKAHARLALAMIDKGGLSDAQKATVRAKAHKILGEAEAAEIEQYALRGTFLEADRTAQGKLANGNHTTQAREHILAASIALNQNDKDEVKRRIDSAQIHLSHSQHRDAQTASGHLEDAKTFLKNDKHTDDAAGKLDDAYGAIQGEPNRLLQMKKARESDPSKRVETMGITPKFVAGSYDEKNRTFDVIILTEGLGNSRDKHYYTGQAIREAVADKVFDPAQAYADHPSKFDDANRPERSIRDLIGYYFDSKVIETVDPKTGKKVEGIGAKLRIVEGADWAVGLVKESIDFNKKFPDKTFMGISINADGDTTPGEINGVEVNKVMKITEAFSADMVTKPARGGRFINLVESAAGATRFQKGTSMPTKAQIVEAATKIKESMKTGTVDPSELTAFIESVEAAEIKESKDGKTEEVKEAKKVDKDGDGSVDDEKQTDTEDQPMDETKKESKKESSAFPALRAAAIAEAEASLKESVKDPTVRKRLAEAESELAIRKSADIIVGCLRESRIPEKAHRKILHDCIGLSEAEIKEKIQIEEEYMDSLGLLVESKRTGGAGETRLRLRESSNDVDRNTTALCEGLVA